MTVSSRQGVVSSCRCWSAVPGATLRPGPAQAPRPPPPAELASRPWTRMHNRESKRAVFVPSRLRLRFCFFVRNCKNPPQDQFTKPTHRNDQAVFAHTLKALEGKESCIPIRAAEYVWPLPMFKGLESVQNQETGLERGRLLPRYSHFNVVTARAEQEGFIQNRGFIFSRRNVSNLCPCISVLNRSRITKRGSKGVGSWRDFWETRRQSQSAHRRGEDGRIFRLSQQPPIPFEP